MNKSFLTLAAAAAMACGSIAFAADETNRAARNGDQGISGSREGQTGAANSSNSSSARDTTSSGGTSSSSSGTSSSSDSSSSTTGLNSAHATGSAAGDMAQASANATGESDIQQALASANDPDKLFLVCAAIDNNAEMQLGQLAQTKATDPQVKQFAQKMMQDHQQAQRDLQEAAQQAGVQLPRSVPATKQQELRVFQSLSGKEFDQQYIACMQAGHAKAVNQYQAVAQLSKNDQIKAYASKTLPTLQQHYQQVQQVASAVGVPSANEAQTAGARMNSDIGDKSRNTGTSR